MRFYFAHYAASSEKELTRQTHRARTKSILWFSTYSYDDSWFLWNDFLSRDCMRLWLYIFIALIPGRPLFALDPEFKIVGQKPLSIQQDQSITIQLTDLIVEDGDRFNYPSRFELKIFEGNNYPFSANTVRPATGFTGTLSVPVRVEKGQHKSEKYKLKIDVKPSAPP